MVQFIFQHERMIQFIRRIICLSDSVELRMQNMMSTDSSIKMDMLSHWALKRTAQHCTYESPTTAVLQHLQPRASTATFKTAKSQTAQLQDPLEDRPWWVSPHSLPRWHRQRHCSRSRSSTKTRHGSSAVRDPQKQEEARDFTHKNEEFTKTTEDLTNQKTPRISFGIEKHVGGLYYEQLYWLYWLGQLEDAQPRHHGRGLRMSQRNLMGDEALLTSSQQWVQSPTLWVKTPVLLLESPVFFGSICKFLCVLGREHLGAG